MDRSISVFNLLESVVTLLKIIEALNAGQFRLASLYLDANSQPLHGGLAVDYLFETCLSNFGVGGPLLQLSDPVFDDVLLFVRELSELFTEISLVTVPLESMIGSGGAGGLDAGMVPSHIQVPHKDFRVKRQDIRRYLSPG